MTGAHGCGTWKKSAKTKGYYRPTLTDTNKWYTQTSTRVDPYKRRGVTKTWSGALQLGKNVYVSGGPWFEYMGTGSGTGDDSFKVHGMNMTQTKLWFKEKGIPYNSIWWQGQDDLGIKVPGGVLWDMGWPWSRSIGYPTIWDIQYWVWTEDDPVKRQVDYATWQSWVIYINVQGELTPEEKSKFMANIMNNFVQYQGPGSALYDVMVRADRDDLLDMLLDIESFYEQRGWSLSIMEKQVIATQWGILWTMILDDHKTFNMIWFRYHDYF